MDGQVDRWVDGQMSRRKDGWMDGGMEGWMDGWGRRPVHECGCLVSSHLRAFAFGVPPI